MISASRVSNIAFNDDISVLLRIDEFERPPRMYVYRARVGIRRGFYVGIREQCLWAETPRGNYVQCIIPDTIY